MQKKKGKGRGFKSLTDAEGKRHVFTHEEARAAGRKGGIAPHRTRGRYRTMSSV